MTEKPIEGSKSPIEPKSSAWRVLGDRDLDDVSGGTALLCSSAGDALKTLGEALSTAARKS